MSTHPPTPPSDYVVSEHLIVSIQEFLDWNAAISVLQRNGHEWRHRDENLAHAVDLVLCIASGNGIKPSPEQVAFIVDVEMGCPEIVDSVPQVLDDLF